jgi:ABC-type nickel/cobalt efflux system permease component RcnA
MDILTLSLSDLTSTWTLVVVVTILLAIGLALLLSVLRFKLQFIHQLFEVRTSKNTNNKVSSISSWTIQAQKTNTKHKANYPEGRREIEGTPQLG